MKLVDKKAYIHASVLFLVAVICLPLHCLLVVSMHRRYLECWRVLFLFLFLTHTVCLHNLWDVKPYASSGVFLSSCLFVEVFLLPTLRMFPSILQGGQPKYLFLRWNFFYVVWFRVVFSFSWGILFLKFFFHLRMFDGANIPKYL